MRQTTVINLHGDDLDLRRMLDELNAEPASNRAAIPELERRVFKLDELRVDRAAGAAPRIVGHAAVFNQEADIGGWFMERVAPGAFKRAIVEDDVRALFNHDPNFVLGRNRAKPTPTLTLSEDETGLLYTVVPPDTQVARDLMVSIDRGDISQGSFGFRVRKQEWDETGEIVKRTLLEVELFDVSPVTFPAYPQTDVGLRALQDYRKDRPAMELPSQVVRRLTQRSREHSY